MLQFANGLILLSLLHRSAAFTSKPTISVQRDVLCTSSSSKSSLAASVEPTIPPELEQTAQHLKKLQATQKTDELDVLGQERERMYREYIQQSANALKIHLKDRGLPNKGRKPELARRLAQDDLDRLYGKQTKHEEDEELRGRLDDTSEDGITRSGGSDNADTQLTSFAGYPIGPEASRMLSYFTKPTMIQEAAMKHFIKGNNQDCSCVLHASTGSGKTIAYLLPVVEAIRQDPRGDGVVFILTPTRELAGQVASVAERLASSASLVQFVTHPSNLSSYKGARIFVGSAKCIYQSLYGKTQTDAPATPKPIAMKLLTNTQYLIVDEVDRLLLRQTQKHEKPAAILISAVTRLSLGRSTLIAASATAGRPVRRELARCLGLPPTQGPPIVRVANTATNDNEVVVSIPDTIAHYTVTVPVDASPGLLLTTAVGKVLRKVEDNSNKNKKDILLVLARSFGLSTQHTVGALQHFGVPASLEASSSSRRDERTTVLVTTEDSVRGMDWNVDYVVLLGRPVGVSEYKHICGRTGRAGRTGTVVTVCDGLQQWETMLGIEFQEWAM